MGDKKFSDVDLEVIGELFEVFHFRRVDALKPPVKAYSAHACHERKLTLREA